MRNRPGGSHERTLAVAALSGIPGVSGGQRCPLSPHAPCEPACLVGAVSAPHRATNPGPRKHARIPARCWGSGQRLGIVYRTKSQTVFMYKHLLWDRDPGPASCPFGALRGAPCCEWGPGHPPSSAPCPSMPCQRDTCVMQRPSESPGPARGVL